MVCLRHFSFEDVKFPLNQSELLQWWGGVACVCFFYLCVDFCILKVKVGSLNNPVSTLKAEPITPNVTVFLFGSKWLRSTMRVFLTELFFLNKMSGSRWSPLCHKYKTTHFISLSVKLSHYLTDQVVSRLRVSLKGLFVPSTESMMKPDHTQHTDQQQGCLLSLRELQSLADITWTTPLNGWCRSSTP